MKRFDALVVGCGAMGSSISYNLASRGLSVITLEKFGLNHEFGSSHGKTRLIRLAYFEDLRYIPLLRRAYEAWREIAAKSGRELMMTTGGLMMGPDGGEFVAGVTRAARAYSLPHKAMSWRDANEAYPAFRLEDGWSAVLDESAGVLLPEECISAYAKLAEEAGCTFRFGKQLTRWKIDRGGIEVSTGGELYGADALVLAGGAWMGPLLGGLAPLTVERQTPFWFASAGKTFSASSMPVFISEERDSYFYGVPDIGHGVKVVKNHGGKKVNPDAVDRVVTEEDESPVTEFVRRRLPALGTKLLNSTTCLYTNTPDQNFLLGQHPDYETVVLAGGFSGHGFKFASVVGEVVADLVTQGRTGYDISFLSPRRFR